MHQVKSPLVTVIVPVYQVEPYLCACIDSILAQTYSNLEIILVDDGSPDGCPAICDAYTAENGRIHVIHKRNGGLSDARNAGLDAATGKWIVFVDSDDLIAPRMIEALVNACPDEETTASVSFSRFSDGETPRAAEPAETVRCFDIQAFTRCRSGMFAWGILYSRSLIEKLHLRFDTGLRNLEDVAWNIIYLSHVRNMLFLPGVMYHYRRNPTSITSQCADKHWLIRSWFEARNSVFSWFAAHSSGEIAAAVLPYTNRYCSNNILAECAVGKLTYSDYAAQRIIPPDVGVRIPEQALEKLFPRIYFHAYMTLMQLRNRLQQ